MNMSEFVEMALKAILLPLLPLVTLYITRWIQAKIDLLTANTSANDKEFLNKYVELAESVMLKSVVFVNQTYVEALKKQGAFTAENQIEAFNLAKERVLSILTEETIEALTMMYGDYMQFIDTTIEELVNYQKG
jgi:hypothetical protein